jgi:CysZ protein
MPTPPFAVSRVLMDVVRTMVIETVFFVVNTILFFASLAFPPATPVLGVVGMVLAGYYFAIAYLEIPLVARDATFSERWQFWSSHPMAILGYGTGVALFLFIPIVNLLFMPAAVAGGVLLFAELSGHVKQSASPSGGVPTE